MVDMYEWPEWSRCVCGKNGRDDKVWVRSRLRINLKMCSECKLRTEVPSLVVTRMWRRWKGTLLRIVSPTFFSGCKVEKHTPSM
ncbi:hypothetical protein AHAS_Ahas11G0232900 [Arachis hypogaea]